MPLNSDSAASAEQATDVPRLVGHLFRHEHGKLVAVLTKVYGMERMELIEDAVQDALIQAMEQWQFKGIPENPTGWLYTVAKNKVLNVFKRESYQREYETAATNEQPEDHDQAAVMEEIPDDQLRMIFTCCHAALTADSQIALVLKTLCGFSVGEIAAAFLTGEETIRKRLTRARQTIRESGTPHEIPEGDELDRRLGAVLETILLIFNEGYSATGGTDAIRHDLCEEAIRLAQMIIDAPSIRRKEPVHSLLALMLLDAARFDARIDSEGRLLSLQKQDRGRWNRRLHAAGMRHLIEASANGHISQYYLLAAISAQHMAAASFAETDWNAILSFYDALRSIDPSPVVTLNRAIAVLYARDSAQAMAELEPLSGLEAFTGYYLYHATAAEVLAAAGMRSESAASFERAIRLAPETAVKEQLNVRNMELNNERKDTE